MSSSEAKVAAQRGLANLTAAQRALLEQRLMARRAAAAQQGRILPRQQNGHAPLSHAQELLWLLSQVFDDGIAYNAPGAFQLEGPLDLEVLAQAFQALTERHEILRTVYEVVDGRPVQVVGPSEPVDLHVVDLSGHPAEQRNTEVQQTLKEESRFRFDLVNGPVMRVTVIRLSENEHVLMVNMHHIATDGYSRTAIYRDLTVLYEAIAEGRPSPLAALPIQYADYAVWQRRWLDGATASNQVEYWKANLSGAPSRLDLPTDFPRPPVRSYLGSNISLMLDMATRQGLRATARGSDSTLFVSLLAIFATLLSRYSGQDDVVIGTPFAGRNRTELESMVGYFINPLALRIDLSGDPTFHELIERARRTTVEAFAHADVPYETVVRTINPERDLSQTPVFQAMIVLHNPAWQTQRPKFEPQGIRCAEITHEKGWAKFDVLLGMSERTNGLNTTWEYSTELFKPATVQRMMEHFRALAESAAAGGDRRLSKLSMLSEDERRKVLVSWNAPAVEPVASAALPKDLFEQQARAHPDAEAVVCGGQRLTYGQLNRFANRVASLLRSHGVGPGTLVGVMMEKSSALVPAVLGVVKAGGAYVPLDPRYPADRLEAMLDDSSPKVLLTQQDLLDKLPQTDAITVAMDAPGCLRDCSDEDPETLATDDDLAYVIFTSGSTGQPKGVMISNGSLISTYRAWESTYGLHELRSHLQMASFSFDVFTGDLVRAMLSGAKLVLCPMEVTVDPPSLYELIVAEQVDAAEFVPATALLLFDWLEQEGKRLEQMRLLAVASEAWRNEQYEVFKSLCGPRTRLVNSYGVTEATIDSTWFERDGDAQLPPGRLVPIGRPFPNSKVYILDRNLDPQPIGIAGELCIAGEGVALGYLNREQLTAERFLADPFSDDPAARMYRTGDLARWLPDGNIEFLGRTDRQLKIRGFRIEPGEIESVLERHAGVRAAAVTDRRDECGDARLVAYISALREQPPTPEQLRALVGENLPGYMIPAAWVFLDSLPLMPSGKVDFDALPDPEFDRSATSQELVPPRTAVERQLAVIWSEVLGVPEVGVYDNFFDLGGHSLLAVRLFSEIERELGMRLPLAALFQSATIAALAQLIDDPHPASNGDGWSSIVPMRSGEGERALFLVGWAGGEILGYHGLVEHLDSVPVMGLRTPGVDGDRLPPDSVQEMAAHYVREIRRAQPEGPYLIGGYCFSGLVAYEMGRQLIEQGQQVEMLALIDAYPYGSSRRPSRLETERVKMREFMDSGARGRAAWLQRRAGSLRARLHDAFYLWTGRLAYELMAKHQAARKHLPKIPWRLVLIASHRARRAYVPPPADLTIDFFRAQREPDARPTPWDGIARGGVRLRQVVVPDVNHTSMMQEPHVQVLAAELGGALRSLGSRS